jgi:hypothetical protein
VSQREALAGLTRGKKLVIGLVAFAVLFGVGLWYAQTRAWYDRVDGLESVTAGGRTIAVSDYLGLDGSSSPLKLRGCFTVDPAALADLPEAEEASPLTTPGWFDCFIPIAIGNAVRRGEARAVVAAANEPAGFDRIIAYFPDGRAFMWRQLRDSEG